jgi:voltage-gated potassium channel
MRRARIAAIYLAAVLALGTFGYMLIEGWSLLDSLYMTVITVATVGYGEVHPLSAQGEIFTIVLVVTGVGGIAFSIATLADFMLEGHLRELMEGRRMTKRIAELRDHYIVIGLGRVGSVVCSTLHEQGVPFVVVDRCDECMEMAEDSGWLYVQGDATNEDVLEEAGVRHAKGLVTALDTDADNLFVALSARGMNADLFIVARSTSLASESKILRSGADRVITPNVIGGRRMASSLLDPLVADYLDIVMHSAEIEYRIEGISISSASGAVGRPLKDSAQWNDSGAYLLAVSTAGEIDGSPSGERVLNAGDELVAFGTAAQLQALAELLRASET